jgi:hypothetical protein
MIKTNPNKLLIINFDLIYSKLIVKKIIPKNTTDILFYDYNIHDEFFFQNISNQHGKELKILFLHNLHDFLKDNKFDINKFDTSFFLLNFKTIITYANKAGFNNIEILNSKLLKNYLNNKKNFLDSTHKTFQFFLNINLLLVSRNISLNFFNLYMSKYALDKKKYEKYVSEILNVINSDQVKIINEQKDEIQNLKSLKNSFNLLFNISKPSELPNLFTTNKDNVKTTIKNSIINKFYKYLKDNLLIIKFSRKLQNSTFFDEKFYLEKYHDLIGVKSPVRHFILYGFDEGRVGSKDYSDNIINIKEKFFKSRSKKSWKYYFLSNL